MIPFRHQPVLLQETMQILDLKPGMKAVDCTVGGGGHGRPMLERVLPSGLLVAIDQDPQALEAAEKNFREAVYGGSAGQTDPAPLHPSPQEPASRGPATQEPTPLHPSPQQPTPPYVMVHSNFSRIKDILSERQIGQLDAALMDLGASSFQFDEGARGFSYRHAGELDMRMDPLGGAPTAYDVVMSATAQDLAHILWRYGEERWSKRIARAIVREREKAPIKTTDQLASVIRAAIPAAARAEGPHPAKRSFQALRIFVNRELEILGEAIVDAAESLAPGGRLAVISYHSLEDRCVKEAFKTLAAGCICPKDFPICACGKAPQGRILTPKPILPQPGEVEENPRSRSAKLRAFEKGMPMK